MNPNDIIENFQSELSVVCEWIDQLLEENRPQGVPIISLCFPNLPKVFPTDLLERAKLVTVAGALPFPALPHSKDN